MANRLTDAAVRARFIDAYAACGIVTQAAAAAGISSDHARGYRQRHPGFTYGVGWEGNYDWGRHPASASFNFEYLGRRSVKILAGTPAWPDDRCNLSGGTTSGGGNYKPAAASTLVGRALRASLDRDRTGAARTIPFASGAVDTPAAATVAVAPASGLLASRSSAPAVAWAGALAPSGGRSPTTASQPLLGWFAVLTPNGASLASRAGAPLVGFAAALSPAGGMQALTSGGPAIGIDGVTLR